MATLGGSVLTLADWAQRLDPKGKTPRIVELLSQTNEIIDDALFKEGNLPTGEKTVIRTGLPSTYWRLLNQGVPTSKSTTAPVTENCGELTARSEVDVKLAKLNGNEKMFRLSEAQAFLEAMSQEGASTMFYGAASDPEEFVGLANRYTSTAATNGQNIILGGGSGADNSSIFLVGWGERTVHGIFPKGSKAGINHKDLGEIDAWDSSNNKFRAYGDTFDWDLGLVVKDWRYVVRIPNIDISAVVADEDGSSVKLINMMLKALHRLPSLAGIKPAFYANRTIAEMLDVQASNKGSVHLKVGEEEGKLKTKLRGVPVRTCDALTEAESLVT